MSAAPGPYVWDLTMVARARLLCGLYSGRAVPPRWRPLARAYCIALLVAFPIYTFYILNGTSWRLLLVLTFNFGLYLVNALTALWTGDEFIYQFYTQNAVTDVTLDSPVVFGNVQRRLKKIGFVFILLTAVLTGMRLVKTCQISFFIMMKFAVPVSLLEVFVLSSHSTKLLVMALFDARLLVLKRRLQRYGFRSAGRARSQPYCLIYHQILQGLDDTNNPLKLLLFFDLIFCCSKIILGVLSVTYEMQTQSSGAWNGIDSIIWTVIILVQSFGHVALLESAATHCEDMAVYTATELIKTPTAAQRRQMRMFLGALEGRGARYRVLRALPLDARFVLLALNFCSAQIFVFINMVRRLGDVLSV